LFFKPARAGTHFRSIALNKPFRRGNRFHPDSANVGFGSRVDGALAIDIDMLIHWSAPAYCGRWYWAGIGAALVATELLVAW